MLVTAYRWILQIYLLQQSACHNFTHRYILGQEGISQLLDSESKTTFLTI